MQAQILGFLKIRFLPQVSGWRDIRLHPDTLCGMVQNINA